MAPQGPAQWHKVHIRALACRNFAEAIEVAPKFVEQVRGEVEGRKLFPFGVFCGVQLLSSVGYNCVVNTWGTHFC